jgi:hypothetical protein
LYRGANYSPTTGYSQANDVEVGEELADGMSEHTKEDRKRAQAAIANDLVSAANSLIGAYNTMNFLEGQDTPETRTAGAALQGAGAAILETIRRLSNTPTFISMTVLRTFAPNVGNAWEEFKSKVLGKNVLCKTAKQRGRTTRAVQEVAAALEAFIDKELTPNAGPGNEPSTEGFMPTVSPPTGEGGMEDNQDPLARMNSFNSQGSHSRGWSDEEKQGSNNTTGQGKGDSEDATGDARTETIKPTPEQPKPETVTRGKDDPKKTVNETPEEADKPTPEESPPTPMDTSEDDPAKTVADVEEKVGKLTQEEPVTTSTSNEQKDSGEATGDAIGEDSRTIQPGPTPKPADDDQEDPEKTAGGASGGARESTPVEPVPTPAVKDKDGPAEVAKDALEKFDKLKPTKPTPTPTSGDKKGSTKVMNSAPKGGDKPEAKAKAVNGKKAAGKFATSNVTTKGKWPANIDGTTPGTATPKPTAKSQIQEAKQAAGEPTKTPAGQEDATETPFVVNVINKGGLGRNIKQTGDNADTEDRGQTTSPTPVRILQRDPAKQAANADKAAKEKQPLPANRAKIPKKTPRPPEATPMKKQQDRQPPKDEPTTTSDTSDAETQDPSSLEKLLQEQYKERETAQQNELTALTMAMDGSEQYLRGMTSTAGAVAIAAEMFERTRTKYLSTRLDQEEKRETEEQRKQERKDAEQEAIRKTQDIVNAQIANAERYGVQLTPDQIEAIRIVALGEVQMEREATCQADPPEAPVTKNSPFITVNRHKPGLPETPRRGVTGERKSPLPEDERNTNTRRHKNSCQHGAGCSFWGIGGCVFEHTDMDKLIITRRLNTCAQEHNFDTQPYPLSIQQTRRGSSRLLENQRALDTRRDDDTLLRLFPVAHIMDKNAKKQEQTYQQYDTAIRDVITPIGLQSKEQYFLNALKRFSNPHPTSSTAASNPHSRQSQGRGGFQQRSSSRGQPEHRKARSPESPLKRNRGSGDDNDNEGKKRSKSRGSNP